MSRRVLVVFPDPPTCHDGGGMLRCAQIVRGLLAADCRVRLVHPGPPAGGLAELVGHHPACESRSIPLTRFDRVVGAVRARVTSRLTGRPRLARSPFFSPRARHWFDRQVREFDPDAVWSVYLHAHFLTRPRRGGRPRWVLDAPDLVSKHLAILHAASKLMGFSAASGPTNVEATDLRPDYYDGPAFAPDPEEFRLIGEYDAVTAISPTETRQIATRVPGTPVTYLPLTCPPGSTDGRHDGGPLAVLTYHPVILHSYLFFARHVLPKVRAAVPGFCLRVVGPGSERLPPFDGIDRVGYVPDIGAEFAAAGFLVLPVFGVTGQQTRIVVAMSRGVPVVTLRRAAEAAGVVHLVNGMVADGADDFAESVVYLSRRPDECRRLGAAARRTAEEEFSDHRLVAAIDTVLGPVAGRPS